MIDTQANFLITFSDLLAWLLVILPDISLYKP